LLLHKILTRRQKNKELIRGGGKGGFLFDG